MAGSANVSFGYVGGRRGPRAAPIMYVSSAETFATTEAGSTQSTATAPTSDEGNEIVVRVILSEEGYVAIGANPTAAVASTTRLAANAEAFFACAPGHKVAVRDTV